jgi:hypothetical protein
MVAAAAKDKALIGAAGVFHVSMVLSLRGMIALPTIRNTAGFDVIATSRDGANHANIQVKTSGARPDYWPICQKIENVKCGDNDYYVLLRQDTACKNSFEGFMLTGKEMRKELEAYIAWYVERGRAAELEKFPHCLVLDKNNDEERTANWRRRWQTWTL